MERIIDQTLPDGGHLIVARLGDFRNEYNDILTPDEEKQLAGISHPDRKCEFVSIRKLIRQRYGNDELLTYAPNGKPGLKMSGHRISISHSDHLLGLLFHPEREVGLDLQHFEEKIHVIKNRFMSEREKRIAQNDTWELLAYWCAKEALYKYVSKHGVNFKTQFFVSPIPKADKATVTGWIDLGEKPEHIDLFIWRMEEHIIAFTQFG